MREKYREIEKDIQEFNPFFAVGFENRDAKVASFYTQKSPSIPTAVCKEFFGDKNKQILRRIPKVTAKNGFNRSRKNVPII